jgi:hypothetical protein
MRRFAAIAVIAVATTGCIGSSAARPSSDRDLAVPWSKTVVTITYYAHQCPPGARCIGQVKSNSSAQQVRVVRNLSCDPAGSADYDNSAAACRALSDIVTKLAKQTVICACAPVVDPPGKAVGYFNGRRRTIPLDNCSLCGVPGHAADLAVLLPGAQG